METYIQKTFPTLSGQTVCLQVLQYLKCSLANPQVRITPEVVAAHCRGGGIDRSGQVRTLGPAAPCAPFGRADGVLVAAAASEGLSE